MTLVPLDDDCPSLVEKPGLAGGGAVFDHIGIPAVGAPSPLPTRTLGSVPDVHGRWYLRFSNRGYRSPSFWQQSSCRMPSPSTQPETESMCVDDVACVS